MTATPAPYTTPIIFSTPMISALLDGRKSQTRRLVTSQWANLKMHHGLGERCFVWVRESYHLAEDGSLIYRACKDEGLASLVEFARVRHGERWKPSIHMPRWASRLTLEVTEVRLQRLQDISEADAVSEGIEPVLYDGACVGWRSYDEYETGYFIEPVNSYDALWESLHGEGSWDTNPEVIAVTFRVHRQNIDALLAERDAA